MVKTINGVRPHTGKYFIIIYKPRKTRSYQMNKKIISSQDIILNF